MKVKSMCMTIMMWRKNQMNDNIVRYMIDFIEEKEKQLQASKFMNENKAKSDVVKSIIDELERKVKDED